MKKIILCIVTMLCLCGCQLINSENSQDINLNNPELKDKFSEYQAYQYYYQKLNNTEKRLYEKMYNASYELKRDVFVSKKTAHDSIRNAFIALQYDHPEFFWLYDVAIKNKGNKTDICLITNFKREDIKEMKKKFDDEIDKIVENAKKIKSQDEKIKYVYDYVCENTEYEEYSDKDQSAYSAVVNRVSVCAGYAKEVQLILNRLGIDTTYIVGTINEKDLENPYHAWNMIKIDNDFYYLDTTWGDAIDPNPHICYFYYMMNSDDMLTLYTPEKDYEKTKSGDLANSNITVLDTYDENLVKNAIKKAESEGRNCFELKVTDMDGFMNRINDGYTIYQLLSSLGINNLNIQYVQVGPFIELIYE